METEKEADHDAEDGSRIPTNLRTLLILEVVGRAQRALTPTEINHELGLPKQSIHRLCTTLVQEGFLAYEPDGKTLRPARRMRTMATGILHASRVHIARHQILEEVATHTGETVNFVVPEERGMSYIDRVETDWPFRVQLPVGTHVPFHCTASGKTFLASLEPVTRLRMVESLRLDALTANTITQTDRLMGELAEIERTGFALDREEFMDGMVAIAVPVRDRQGRYLASLAFHGPTLRLTEDYLTSNFEFLAESADRLATTIIED